MELTTALLAEFARVKAGQLTVVGGGVTRVTVQQVPAPLPLYLGIVVSADPREVTEPIPIKIRMDDPDARNTPEFSGLMNVGTGAAEKLEPGEQLQMPFALGLAGFRIEQVGEHRISIFLRGEIRRELSVWVRDNTAT